MKRRALISVSEKPGIEEVVRRLLALEKDQWEIISSGGTAKYIAAAGYPVTDISVLVQKSAKRLIMQALVNLGLNYDETLLDGFIDEIDASILDHLVLSLRPEIHGGLLAQDKHAAEMEKLGFEYIDLAIVDFYPLKKALDKVGATVASIIDATDMGGPAMVGSGAKGSVMGARLVVCDRADWIPVIERLETGYWPEQGDEYSTALAAKAFGVVATYRLESARFHSGGKIDGMVGTQVVTCKYGENPAHSAELFSTGSDNPLALHMFKQVAGTAPSYINLTDIDRARRTILQIAVTFLANTGKVPCIAIVVKHGNACGVGVADTTEEAMEKMIKGDPMAMFGGVVVVNFELDEQRANVLRTFGMPEGKRRILDGVAASFITPEARGVLDRKADKCRMWINSALATLSLDYLERVQYRSVCGGFLRQTGEPFILNLKDERLNRLAGGMVTEANERDLLLAFAIGSTSVSNTITLVRYGMLIGNAVGQHARVRAAKLALMIAQESGHDTAGATAYSDSFFPQPDGFEVLANAGVSLVFASSGSINDALVRKAVLNQKIPVVAFYTMPDAVCRGFYGH